MKRQLSILVLSLSCLVPAVAFGDTVFSTFGAGDSYGTGCYSVAGSGTGVRQDEAFPFTVSGGTFSLDSVDFATYADVGAGPVRLSVVEDSSGAPGVTIVDSTIATGPFESIDCTDTAAPGCDGTCAGMFGSCQEDAGACVCMPSAPTACGGIAGAPQCYGDCGPSQVCVDQAGTCACQPAGSIVSATFTGAASVEDAQTYWLVVETEPVTATRVMVLECSSPPVVTGRGYRENGGSWQVFAGDIGAAYRILGTAPIMDTFKCYKVKDLKQPAFTPVVGASLADQFVTQDADILKLVSVCTPTSLDGSLVADDDTHQCCYKIKAAALATTPSALMESASMQDSTVQVKKPSTLCVPCTKTLLP